MHTEIQSQATEQVIDAAEGLAAVAEAIKESAEVARDEAISEATVSAHIAESTAAAAESVALETAAEVSEIRDELSTHEDKDEWLRRELEATNSRVSTLASQVELLLTQSTPPPLEPEQATPPEETITEVAEVVTEPEEVSQPPIPEQNESADGLPAVEAEKPARRKRIV